MAVANALGFWALLVSSGSSPASFETWSRHFWALGVAPLVVAVLNGLLPVRFKEILVFWRISHPLPGTRAFTALAPRDSRIDLGKLQTRHGPLPEEPTAQNQLWYRIYKTQDSRPSVSGAHRIYLLTRDATGLAALAFVVLGLTSSLIHGVPLPVHLFYVLALGLQYELLAISARNYGNRFVLNVLAEESASL